MLICAAILLHYEALSYLDKTLKRLNHIQPRIKVLIGVTDQLFLDCIYFSFITYTTVGYGDLIAQGTLRYLTGVEALTGLI